LLNLRLWRSAAPPSILHGKVQRRRPVLVLEADGSTITQQRIHFLRAPLTHCPVQRSYPTIVHRVWVCSCSDQQIDNSSLGNRIQSTPPGSAVSCIVQRLGSAPISCPDVPAFTDKYFSNFQPVASGGSMLGRIACKKVTIDFAKKEIRCGFASCPYSKVLL
jgi:hypothetical protein